MHCATCNSTIDPETDRHLEITERLVVPDWGIEDSQGEFLCENCMNPRLTKLGPRD